MTDVCGGFSSVARVDAARSKLLEASKPLTDTERVSLLEAGGRVLSAPVRSNRDVPAYQRVAMDGWAVRARDTFGASDRSPVTLGASETVGPDSVVPVDTGQKLPSGADAVVQVEQTEPHDDEVEIFEAVAGGENVAPIGEDVEMGQQLFDSSHQLRPSDLGLLKSTGVSDVPVYERPTVSVIPTGEELVQSTPEPGETIETNGQTVAQYVDRWGGTPIYRDVVPDEFEALGVAIERDLTADVVVTTGGTSVGERDLVPSVVSELGRVLVHGVALSPGHPVALGIVDDTPVVMLPGYPVSCIVTAVQFLRPLIKHVGHCQCDPHPATEARLSRKIHSEPGVRTYARVTVDRSGEQPIATTAYVSGAGVLSSVAFTDGWVVVPESREGIPEDELVTVENWEAHR
ncbi:molybdopterin molybdotransferase MoeA [Halocatena salina]|uniref:Molybdopterin molybdotransferase MoeA n=1 Tax=Halocatena salina TaxID=2934340 RepID=A0A8U0A6D0_9EURY|nr:molybdopterin molybdotransferase MoeA [Halocatena salina]UPM43487.1 molybdopterin molybdotransferase MoeA [Halocatena salina]